MTHVKAAKKIFVSAASARGCNQELCMQHDHAYPHVEITVSGAVFFHN